MIRWSEARLHVRRLDWSLVTALCLLLLTGVLFIYSAGYRSHISSTSNLYHKQLVWVVAGTLIFLGLTIFNYNQLGALAGGIYGAGLLGLVIVLVVGTSVYGARRWLNLFGIYIQPAEFAKSATLVFLAYYLSRPARRLDRWTEVATALGIAALPMILIIRQPDLGTAMVFVPMVGVMLFTAGMPLRMLAILGGLGLCLAPIGWFGLGDYQKERLLVFFDPGRDPLGAGWNKMQSLIAVGSGGLTGKGYLNGTQNILGFLPRTVAPTDFIYSVIAEETGFTGSVMVLALYGVVLIGAVRAALAARNRFGRLLAIGAAALLFSHVFVNVAMTIGLMPITGLPLPLISYGGSFMMGTMILLGLVQSVYVRRYRH